MIDRSAYYLTRLLADGRVVDVTPLSTEKETGPRA